MHQDKTPLTVTGLSGMMGDRFQELYGHKFDFTNLDLTTNVDITDVVQVNKAIKQSQSDIILHLAAFTDVDRANQQKDDKKGLCYKVNVVGTDNIVKAAKTYGKYLIYISTDFIFDGTNNKPYNEDHQPNPIEWYGQTKAMAEEIVQKNLDKHSWAILRPSFPFRSNYKQKGDIVRNIIDKLKKDSLPPMFTDHWITPTFVDDLCKVFFMFTLKRPKGIYHATGSSFVTDFELATLVKETFELKGKIKQGSLEDYLKTAKRPYQKSLKLSNAKLQEELGNPMLPVASALQIMKTQV